MSAHESINERKLETLQEEIKFLFTVKGFKQAFLNMVLNLKVIESLCKK